MQHLKNVFSHNGGLSLWDGGGGSEVSRLRCGQFLFSYAHCVLVGRISRNQRGNIEMTVRKSGLGARSNGNDINFRCSHP